MADFVIVVVALAGLASPAPAPGADAGIPQNAPTIGFRFHSGQAECERAVATSVASAGTRLVCLPVEAPHGELASAH